MIGLIRAFFVKNKLKKLQREIERKYIESVNYQRNGKLREYAQTLTDIQALEEAYANAQKENEHQEG